MSRPNVTIYCHFSALRWYWKSSLNFLCFFPPQPENRRLCEPLHTDVNRAARYFLYTARHPRQEKVRVMDIKTADQIRFFVAIATMITIAACIGIAPTLWASF